MKDEIILKLITSPIEGDVVIGANYLIKRPLQDIISFYEKYGDHKTEIPATPGFYSYYSIRTKLTTPFIKIVKEDKLIWVGNHDSFILDPQGFSTMRDSWHDKTI